MIQIDVWRGSEIVHRFSGDDDVAKVTHVWEINASASVTIELPSTFAFALEDELHITTRNCMGNPVNVGRFTVMSIEASHGSDESTMKVTAVDPASEQLSSQAKPGTDFLEGVSIVTGIARIKAYTLADVGHAIEFSAVNPPEIGDSVIKDVSGGTMLDCFSQLCGAIGARWRTRPDLSGTKLEYGLFGELRDFLLRTKRGIGSPSPQELATMRTAYWSTLAVMETVGDWYTCAYAEGGSYGENNEERINLRGTNPPAGFTLTEIEDTAGHKYARLCKDNDENGVPFADRHSTYLSAGRLAATREVEGNLSTEQLAAAKGELLRRTVQFLTESSVWPARYSVDVPGVLLGILMPGDRFNLVTREYADRPAEMATVYVGSIQTAWNDDGTVVTSLECGTRLASFESPIESYFETRASPGQPPWSIHKSYLVEVVAGGAYLTYNFPTTYTTPPGISLLPEPGCTLSITALDEASVTIFVDPVGGPCATVRFYVTPYG